MKLANAVALAIALGLGVCATGAQAAPGECDRACLKQATDSVLASMARHDPAAVPVSQQYMATENNRPASLPMMTLWRMVTAIKSTYHVIDTHTRQVFFISTAAEGPQDVILFGRLKFDAAAKISELELYEDRSRADGGFQYALADGPMEFPTKEWTEQVPQARLPARAELLEAGRSIFDPKLKSLAFGDACMMMENGKFSDELPDVLQYLLPPGSDMTQLKRNAKGNYLVPCMAPDERPADLKARTDIADETTGVVVSIAMIPGLIQPYIATNPTDSAFVPDDIMQPYLDLLKKQHEAGKYNAPRVKALADTSVVAQLYRVFDGKIQGMSLFFNIEPAGSISPWVAQQP